MVIVVLCTSFSAYAYDFEIDGIRYDITSFTDLTVTASSLSEALEGALNIPSFVEFNGKKLCVNKLGEYFAANNNRISSVIVGDSITSIESFAFFNCPEIASIILKGVKTIGPESFKQCIMLSKIELSADLTSIGEGAFEKCESLKELFLPDLITVIGANTFRGCSLLDNISLTKIEQIRENAFSDCSSLKNLVLSDNLTYIGSNAFSGTEFDTFIIPNCVTELGTSILSNCKNLKSLTVGSGLSVLSSNPVIDCPNINELIFNDSDNPLYIDFGGEIIESFYFRNSYNDVRVNIYSGAFDKIKIDKLYLGRNIYPKDNFDWRGNGDINLNPFTGNKYITKVVIGKKVTDLSVKDVKVKKDSGLVLYNNSFGYFEACDSIQNVEIIGNLNCISNRMFYGTKISQIFTPNTISSIGSFAFSNCAYLKEISIGKKCKTIGQDAFSGDEALTTINLFCLEPPEYLTGFENSEYININVNIPPNIIDIYKKSEPWCNFWNMQEDENLLTEFIFEPFKFELINNADIELVGFTDLELKRIDIPSIINYNNKDYVVTNLSFQGTILKNCNEVIIPNTASTISDSMFKDWENLEKIDLGQIQSIPNNCFRNCVSLKNITIPRSCISIGNDVFNGCDQLTTLCFEYSEKPLVIGNYTHANLSSSITPFPNASNVDERRTGFRNGYYDGLFYGLPIEEIMINRDIELPIYYKRTIGNSSSDYTTVYNDIIYYPPFYGLDNLKYIEIGENVSAICKNQIEAVMNAVPTTVDYKNFSNCNNIKVVVSKNPSAPIGGGFTQTVYENATLFLPKGGTSKYSEDNYWKKFVHVIEGNYIPVESFKFEQELVELSVGEVLQLTVLFEPENATPYEIKWKSSNEKVVAVSDSGLISGISEGSATITAAMGDFTATCEVSVYTPTIVAKQVVLNIDKVELKIGETVLLEATVLPEDTTDKTLGWKSSNEEVAIVDESGLVTAIGEGKAIIAVTCGEASAQCEIIVLEEEEVEVESIFLQPYRWNFNIGDTNRIYAIVIPEKASNKALTWLSSDESVAIIDENGNVTFVGVGKVTITALCGDLSAECTLKCYPQIGDANWSGSINVADAVDISNYVVKKKSVPECWDEDEWIEFYTVGANVNGSKNGTITFADAFATVELSLTQSAFNPAQDRIVRAYSGDVESSDALVFTTLSETIDGKALVPVNLDNSVEYVALQADFLVPKDADVEIRTGKRAEEHYLETMRLEDQRLRVVLFNLGNKAFAESNEPILEIVVDSKFLDIDDLTLSNILAADADANEYILDSRMCELTSVEGVSNDSIRIEKISDGVQVYNANGKKIEICTIEGQTVRSFVAKETVETIIISSGLYIVKAGDKTIKVVL